MKNNVIQGSLAKAKAFINKVPKKTRNIILIIAVLAIGLSVGVSVAANSGKTKYVELYSGLSTSEAADIFASLKDMGADAKVGSDGTIMVPESEYDVWILQMAAMGYPKTALTYDIFSSNSGMTTTESEKAQWLVYQLQDRIQATLERINGVVSATVTITVPETTTYVWEAANTKEKASAGVLLTLERGVTLSGEQVSSIRNLIASSVPKMQPEDVTVVDAGTMLELIPDRTGSTDTTDYNLAFQLMIQQKIEENVVRLLTPRYGTGGVVAVAQVTIDYDKMMTEKLELTPNENGDGYLTHNEGGYSLEGNVAAGDVVGEDSNTDIPTYAYNNPTGDEGMTDYTWSRDYDYGYIKTQIESGNAILARATISVMVDEKSLTETRVTELKSLVSGCTDIPVELVSVSAFDREALPDTSAPAAPADSGEEEASIIFQLLGLQPRELMLIGIGVLLLILVAVVVIVIIKRKKRARLMAESEAEELARQEELLRKQTEIEDYKRTLEDIAKGRIDPKGEAIVEEVREFAKNNPQIAANLIRAWLKEG